MFCRMPTNKKLLLFASGDLFSIGGVQRSYQVLTDYLVKQGWKIDVIGWEITDSVGGASQAAYKLDDRIKIQFFPRKLGKKLFTVLCQAVTDINPDISLIVNSSQIGLFWAQVLTHLDRRYVYSIRGSSEYCLRYLWPSLKTMESVFLNAEYGHVLMSSYKSLFSDAVSEKLDVIPSQIEPSRVNASPEKLNASDRYVVLYSGRFSFEKRVHLLIQAFSNIRDDFPEWDLWLYGVGPLEGALKALSENLGGQDRIVFGQVKNTDEMYEVYPQVHLKVLTSEQEGCPMALREAMSHGIPVIGYEECSGTNEIITHGSDGLLLDNDDRLKRLMDGMTSLMSQPELRRSMGQKAQITASKYQPLLINRQWEQLLLKAIDGTPSKEIANKYIGVTEWAEKILKDMIQKERFSNAYIFDRDPVLFEKHKNEYLLIYGHRLFDKKFYLEEYFDVKKLGIDPLLHYLTIGWKKGYNPSPEFDTRIYSEMYLDSPSNSICPLFHYYSSGCFNGNYPIPVKTDYFEKWPNRKPNKIYSIRDDLSQERKYFEKNNYQAQKEPFC